GTPSSGAVNTPPTGAVERTQPRDDERPGRVVRPSIDGDKRVRGQQGIENGAGRETERPRIENRPEPRIEPRTESPRSEAPRPESPRSEPPPRVETPRNDPPPRHDPPPRND